VQILGSGLNFAKTIVLNGTGVGGTGALENLVGGSNTWSGNILLNSDAAIGVGSGTTLTQITAAISGKGSLNKVGLGTLVLNAVNTYSAQTTVSAGIVNVQNSLGLGLITGGVAVSSGATLQLQASVPGKALTLNGVGFGMWARCRKERSSTKPALTPGPDPLP